MSAKVSICIPCYNNADEVERLLTSVYSQDFTDFEVNLSDDSTNDETERLVGDRFPNVKYRHNKKPFGHIFNWNEAIRMAGGAYIKIMFSDDWFTDGTSLGKMVKLLDDNPDAVLAFSGSRQVMLDGQDAGAMHHVASGYSHGYYDRHASDRFIEGLQRDYRNLFTGNQIGAPSAVIYRRGSALTLFDEKSNWASDMFLYFDLFQKSPVFAYTREPLISIGMHEKQYTESFSEKDMRIYNDYRYMYTKYSLCKSKACRIYFLRDFIIKYGQKAGEAKALGIGVMPYLKYSFMEFTDSLRCFVNHRIWEKRKLN